MESIKSKFNRGTEEMFTYLRPLIRKSNVLDTKFVIFHQGRTGSDLLRELLNSHPTVHCDPEIFYERRLFPQLYLKSSYTITKKSIYGFKVKLYQLKKQRIDPQKFIFDLYEDGWKIVYLNRLNILRQAASNIIGHTTQKWHDRSREPLQKTYIDPSHLIKRMEKIEEHLVGEKKALEEISYMKVIYENDLLRSEKHQETLDRVFDYLSIASVPVKTTLNRTSSDQMLDFIQNYQEVVDCVSKTKYAQFLQY